MHALHYCMVLLLVADQILKNKPNAFILDLVNNALEALKHFILNFTMLLNNFAEFFTFAFESGLGRRF